MNTARDFVVVDVETSGFDPAAARVLSLAALTITADGSIENSMYTLLNPGVDPGPTNIHGLTPAMLAGQPCFADIAEDLAPLLRGRILVAHNVGLLKLTVPHQLSRRGSMFRPHHHRSYSITRRVEGMSMRAVRRSVRRAAIATVSTPRVSASMTVVPDSVAVTPISGSTAGMVLR